MPPHTCGAPTLAALQSGNFADSGQSQRMALLAVSTASSEKLAREAVEVGQRVHSAPDSQRGRVLQSLAAETGCQR